MFLKLNGAHTWSGTSMKSIKVFKALPVLVVFILAGCSLVRQADLNAWPGTPVVELEKHPVLRTMRLVKTRASDGTEIWNFVNSAKLARCSSITDDYLDDDNYLGFINCVKREAACNNIFYVKNGIVERYTPVGSGGAICYTNQTLQPGYRGPVNIR